MSLLSEVFPPVKSGPSPWITVAADYTAADGDRIMADTSFGEWSLTLPVEGTVEIVDALGVWETSPLLIVPPSGRAIRGVNGSLLCDQTASLTLICLPGSTTWVTIKAASAKVRTPVNKLKPSFTGVARDLELMTGDAGIWEDVLSLSYQWRADGVAIPGATSLTYTTALADAGKILTLAVTGTNDEGTLTAVSNGLMIVAAKTTAQFNSHIAALATDGEHTWNDYGYKGLVNGALRTTALTAASGSMYGSPWQSVFYRYSMVCRMIQHALPSEGVFTSLMANQGQVFFRVTYAGMVDPWYGITRNGYTSHSEADGSPDEAYYCTEYIRWDPISRRAYKGSPNSGGPEIEYTW